MGGIPSRSSRPSSAPREPSRIRSNKSTRPMKWFSYASWAIVLAVLVAGLVDQGWQFVVFAALVAAIYWALDARERGR